MILYRIERNGLGAFSGGLVRDAWWALDKELDLFAEPDPLRHPTPWFDGPDLGDRFRSTKHFCAFKSTEQLLRWFDSEAHRRKMAELGGRVIVYEVSPKFVIEGNHQVVFEKAKAEQVDDIPIPTLT
jgi:hypothetical protein